MSKEAASPLHPIFGGIHGLIKAPMGHKWKGMLEGAKDATTEGAKQGLIGAGTGAAIGGAGGALFGGVGAAPGALAGAASGGILDSVIGGWQGAQRAAKRVASQAKGTPQTMMSR